MSRTRRKVKHTGWGRHPKTLNEIKQVSSSVEQGLKVRAKRNVTHMPHSWEDKPVAAWKENYTGRNFP